MSSAKSTSYSLLKSCHVRPHGFPVVAFFITQSITTRKRRGEITQPCRTPDFTWNHSLCIPSCLTQHWLSSYMSDRIFITFLGNPYAFRMFHIVPWWTLSKAFSKSMKFIYSDEFHSIDCSMMVRRTNIWSTHDLPLLNPACSSRSCLSTLLLILFKRILQKTLPGTDNKLIPLQLPQSVRSPFFGNLTIIPFFHASGTFSLVHTRLGWTI